MSINLEIEPGKGIGPIKLGASQIDTRIALDKLGFPLCASHDRLDYFCDNSIQVEYENNYVRFIGISDHAEIECTYDGIDVFNIEAIKLFKLVATKETVVPHIKPGDTCYFPMQGVNLWESDTQYDRKGGYRRLVYAQVGIQMPENA